jgi:hypothetical protein
MKLWTSHIIIEGPDATGKTTLAQKLAICLGWKYHHEGQVPAGKSALAHYRDLLMTEEPTVFDRFHIGEYCYGMVMRNHSGLHRKDYTLLQRLIRASQTKVVLCLPPLQTCWTRWKEEKLKRHEYVTDDDKYTEVYLNFEKFSATPYIDHTLKGAGWPDVDFVLESVAHNRLAPLPYGVIGSHRAKYLIVGEQVGFARTQPDKAVDTPFFGWDHSSGMLNETLLKAEISETDIVLANVSLADGTKIDFKELIKMLPNLQMAVALGNEASKGLREQGIAHGRTNHPSYVKRFRWQDTTFYVDFFKSMKNYRPSSVPFFTHAD